MRLKVQKQPKSHFFRNKLTFTSTRGDSPQAPITLLITTLRGRNKGLVFLHVTLGRLNST